MKPRAVKKASKKKASQRSYLTVRIDAALKDAYVEKCERHGSISEITRELVSGFVDDRVTIKPPQNAKESIYVD